MELSIKKLNNALYRFKTKDYQYNPSKFIFDEDSDPDYTYIAVNGHYIIRVPKNDINDILSVKKLPGYRKMNLEQRIKDNAEDSRLAEFTYKGIERLSDKLTVMNFYSEKGTLISIDSKLFKEFFNKPIEQYGVPGNITFSGIDDGKISYNPLIVWQDDEAIAYFLPIMRKDK